MWIIVRIHEDIKPDNILLRKGPSGSSYDFTPLLTDFGHSHFRVAKEEGDDMGLDRQGNQTYGKLKLQNRKRNKIRGLTGPRGSRVQQAC